MASRCGCGDRPDSGGGGVGCSNSALVSTVGRGISYHCVPVASPSPADTADPKRSQYLCFDCLTLVKS
jgi:hypothetical protein